MISLREKFRGCIAGSWVGSAMGAPVEGWSRERIKDPYTNDHRTIEETADGLFESFMARTRRMEAYLQLMDC